MLLCIMQHMNAAQCLMARVGLGWTREQLAEKAGVHRHTVARFEGSQTVNKSTAKLIQMTLEAAGVVFVDDDGPFGPGVRLPKKSA